MLLYTFAPIELLFKTRNCFLVAGHLVAEPAVNASDSRESRAGPGSDSLVGLSKQQKPCDKDTPSEHEPFALGEEVTQE